MGLGATALGWHTGGGRLPSLLVSGSLASPLGIYSTVLSLWPLGASSCADRVPELGLTVPLLGE